MKLITAIVRTTCLEKIVRDLRDAGIKGMTITEVKGIGEQVELFRPYTVHRKIELFVPDERAEEVSRIILEHSHTGLAGDGIIAVSPIEHIVKIRTKERIS
ncbi:P-II family nitrogen regulator [hot springs metagenome]|uniref:P-II family nitrogen regulator n=1 Tax=hot springs metagenome TaxID=433727 RepID=A0A5J4KUC5_9ZZZZ